MSAARRLPLGSRLPRLLLRLGAWLGLPLCVLLLLYALLGLLPPPPLLDGVPFARLVTDAEGGILRMGLAEDQTFRLRVRLDDIAPEAVQALIRYEDRHFWAHPGVNVPSLLRAAWGTYLGGERRRGGSTITMQVARLRLGLTTSDIGGKLRQIWTALLLVILGHISFTYPLVVRNLIGAIEEVDPAYEEVAMTLGAKPFRAFRTILMPIIKSSVVAGCILAFTRSLGETGATIAISDSVNTVPIYITNLVQDHMYTEAAMCSIVLIAICFVLMMVVRMLTHRRQGRDA